MSSGVYNKSTTQAEIVVNGPKCAHAENAVKLRETAPHALAAPRSEFHGKKKGAETAPHVPRVLGSAWTTNAYTKTIHAACRRAGLTPWGANRLRHAFATDVRRAFGLDAARAVLGHAGGGCVTDVYTFDALADEMVRAAAPAVEALG